MLAFALSAALHLASASAPSAADLANKTWLSQAPSDAPVAGPVKSLFELNRELQTLERDKPGLGFPIAFIAIGGGALLFDALFLYAFTITGALYYLWPILVIIGVAALVGFVGVGFMMLGIRLGQRARYDQRMDEIREELDRRRGEHPYGLQPSQDYYPPPPPPPPPPPVGFVPVPAPQLVLAEF